jgi:predicted membrane protein
MLSHFSAMAVFALCLSVVFGVTQRDEPRKMIHFGIFCFALCIFGTIAAGWAMYFIKH